MGNFNTTQRERKRELRRQLYEQQILAAAATWQSRVQPVAPPPVAPNLSYDELVVAEANRRIEEEKRREIALAEKKRFEEDVAEKIALAKDPNHKTRAMIEEYNKPENVQARRAASIQKMKLQRMEFWCPSHLKLTDDDRNKLEKLMAEYYKLIHKKQKLELGPVGNLPYDYAEIMYRDKVRSADIWKERETIHSIYGQRPRRR